MCGSVPSSAGTDRQATATSAQRVQLHTHSSECANPPARRLAESEHSGGRGKPVAAPWRPRGPGRAPVCGVHRGQRERSAEVTVTEIPQSSPLAPCAWVESGDTSDLLQACRDVRGVRSLPSLFFLYVRPYGTAASCPAPVTSSSPFPQDPCLPSPPRHLLPLLPPERTLQRGRGSCRGEAFPPPAPTLGRRRSTYAVLRRTARFLLPWRRNYSLAQGRQQLEGSRGPVERTEL